MVAPLEAPLQIGVDRKMTSTSSLSRTLPHGAGRAVVALPRCAGRAVEALPRCARRAIETLPRYARRAVRTRYNVTSAAPAAGRTDKFFSKPGSYMPGSARWNLLTSATSCNTTTADKLTSSTYRHKSIDRSEAGRVVESRARLAVGAHPFVILFCALPIRESPA